MIINFASRTGFATPLPAAQFTVAAPPAAPIPALLPTTQISQIATTASITAGIFDTVIVINKAAASATAIAIPQAAKYLGAQLFILDWNGNAGVITLTPAGADQINAKPTWSITSTATAPAAIRLIPVNQSGMAGWLLA
jgi:hypothetical protein